MPLFRPFPNSRFGTFPPALNSTGVGRFRRAGGRRERGSGGRQGGRRVRRGVCCGGAPALLSPYSFPTPARRRPLVPAEDTPLVLVQPAMDTGVHSKTSWRRRDGAGQAPRFFAGTRGFRVSWVQRA